MTYNGKLPSRWEGRAKLRKLGYRGTPRGEGKSLAHLGYTQEHEGPTHRVDLINLGLTRLGPLRAESMFKFEHYPGKGLSSQGKKRASRLFHFVAAENGRKELSLLARARSPGCNPLNLTTETQRAGVGARPMLYRPW